MSDLCSAEPGTQGFVYAGQALYQIHYIPSPHFGFYGLSVSRNTVISQY